jgi:quercetin dioxygenase-like cupin family protein
MGVLRSKRAVALVAAIVVAAGLAAVGISAVLSQTVVVDGTNIHFRVVRTVANDFDSGWHTHPGLAIVQVQQGSLQITQAGSCTAKTVGAGETYIEVPYTPVRAVATGFVSWTTTFLVHYEEPVLTPLTTSPC